MDYWPRFTDEEAEAERSTTSKKQAQNPNLVLPGYKVPAHSPSPPLESVEAFSWGGLEAAAHLDSGSTVPGRLLST